MNISKKKKLIIYYSFQMNWMQAPYRYENRFDGVANNVVVVDEFQVKCR